MDKTTRKWLDDVRAPDGELQFAAYEHLMEATEHPVEWAYEAWDELEEGLTHKDNHVRAISAQLLNNLAKSDPEMRILGTLPALIEVTRDKRFVTARHCLQSLWKVGLVGEEQRRYLLTVLERRFADCAGEKNCKLIRYDIIVDLYQVFEATGDAAVQEKAMALIATEEDEKYRKKYGGVWKRRKKGDQGAVDR